jgi:hypothetical protein
VVELEDLALRRDYKLKPSYYGHCDCGSTLGLLRADNTIMSMCNDRYCSKRYPITRFCSHCDAKYSFEDIDCVVCDVELIKLTEAEVTIEDNQKLFRRIARKLKENKITQAEYNETRKRCEEEIEICRDIAEKIREKRQIEPSSETQTPKQ